MRQTLIRLERIIRNLRFAIRFLARTPSFTIPAVLSLALGIAVNTTIFSVVNVVLLRPLGAGDGNLVRIGRSVRGDRQFRSISYEDYRFLKEQAGSLSDLIGHQIQQVPLGGTDGAESVSSELVAGNYFIVLGAAPRPGRGFTAEEDSPAAKSPVAVVSDRFWRRRLGADPGVLQRGLILNDIRFTIVGVGPPGFTGTFPGVDTDVWIPATAADLAITEARERGPPSMALIGRLKPGVSMATAEAELHALADRLRSVSAEASDKDFSVTGARGVIPAFAQVLRIFLLLLMAVVAVVLLIACANVASLLLARASARTGEIAVRMALGGSRGQIISQLLAESMVLALLGGGLGLLLTLWPIRLLNNWSPMSGPTGAPIFLGLEVDGRVLLFTALVTLLTTLAFGLAPAVQATRVDVVSGLKDAKSLARRRRSRLRGGLVVAQVGLSFVLLVAATLLFRSLSNTSRVELGFEPENLMVASYDLRPLQYSPERSNAFNAELLERARSLRGVTHTALADFVPLVGGTGHPQQLSVPGLPGEGELSVPVGRVSDDYFATLGQPLLRGRDFAPRDARAGSPRVAIVNEAMARRYFPGQGAVGKRFGLGEGLAEYEIVGVAADARFRSFGGEVEPLVYLPGISGRHLHARTPVPAASALAELRRVARDLDPRAAPLLTGLSMRERMAASPTLIPVRIAKVVFGVAGGIALVLASGGLYGLVCYSLQQRLKEIGIRVALGATPGRVFSLVVGGAARLSLAGILIGVLLAAAAMRLLTSWLYGLSPTDPVTFGAVAGLLGLVTLAAGYVGARRGLTNDPVAVLREE
jgi:predicted permease